MKTLGRDVENTNTRASRSFRNIGRDTDNFLVRMKRLATGVKSVGSEIWRIARPAGMIFGLGTAIGSAVQSVGALSGGVIGLLPRLVDLSGMLAPMAAGFVGIGGALLTTHLAFNGVSQAISGNAQALRRLTPEARQFVVTLRQMKPLMRDFERSAQSGIFGPARGALARVRQNAPQLQTILRGSSNAVGGVINEAASRILNPGTLGDIGQISRQGNMIVRDLGTGILNLGDALRHVAVAATPFTRWLDKTILGWTRNADVVARNGRETGRLATFFDRTRVAMTNMGHILSSLWITFRNLGRDARPLGAELYGSAERTTAAWARLTSTVGSRQRLTREFLDMGKSVKSLVDLVGMLGQAIFHMGSSGTLSRTVNGLQRLVPILQNVLTRLADTFGPTMAQTLVEFGNVLNDLTAAGGGPFSVLLNVLNLTLRAIHGILNAAGPFKSVFAAVFETALLTRWLAKLGLITIGWNRVAVAAERAAIAEGAAMGGAGGAAARGRGVGIGLGPVLQGLGIGSLLRRRRMVGAARAGTGARFVARTEAGATEDLLVGGGLMAGLRGGAGAALGAAGRFFLPLAAISGGLGALTANRSGGIGNQIAQTAFAGVNSATLGLPTLGLHLLGRKSPAEEAAAQQQAAQAWQQQLQNLRAEAAARRSVVDQLTAEARIRGASRGNAVVAGLNRVFRQAGGGAAGLRAGVAAGFTSLGRIAGTGPGATAQRNRIERALLHADPGTAARIMSLESGLGNNVQVANGRIFRGGGGELEGLKRQITLPGANVARLRTAMIASIMANGFGRGAATGDVTRFLNNGMRGDLLTQDQRNAVAAAVAAVNIQKYARHQAGATFSYAPKHAGGGRIGGRGLGDTVPVGGLAAPGELIVNRHTEARANSMLAPLGHSLGGLVGSETRRHSDGFATGGRYHGFPMPHAGIASLGDLVLGKFPGLAVTSTTRGTHANGSYHYKGEAIDLGGASGTMETAGRWIQSHLAGSLLEGIHNDTLSVKNGRPVSAMFWGPATWAAHRNHIHLASAGGRAPAQNAAATATRPRTGGGQIPNLALGRGVGRAQNAIMGFAGINFPGLHGVASGGGAAAGGAPGPGAHGVYSKNALRSLASSVGFPTSTLGMASAIALAESSGRASASHVNTDGSTDRGLWQINSVHGALSTFDPVANARAALSISHGGHDWNPWTTYKSGAYRQFMARGGRAARWGGWNASGLNNVFSTPTLIGVGEKGAERVTVRPAGSSSGGTRTIAPVFHIYGNNPDDVRREVEQALVNVIRHLDHEPVDGSDTGGV